MGFKNITGFSGPKISEATNTLLFSMFRNLPKKTASALLHPLFGFGKIPFSATPTKKKIKTLGVLYKFS